MFKIHLRMPSLFCSSTCNVPTFNVQPPALLPLPLARVESSNSSGGNAMPDIHTLLDRLWRDYASLNHQARMIHSLLGQAGEVVVNDHIALRTFDDPRVGLEVMARAFIREGYQPR